MRAPTLLSAFGLAAALAVAPAFAAPKDAAAEAPSRAEVSATVGSTAAILGDIKERGLAASLSVLWPVEDRLAFGVALLADDLGSNVVELFEPTTGASLGLEEARHRAVYGAAWRLDVRPREDLAWRPYASGTWGWSLVRDDVRGRTLSQLSSTGFTLGAGVRHAVRSSAAVGFALRYHRLLNDRVGRYVSAGMEWSWR